VSIKNKREKATSGNLDGEKRERRPPMQEIEKVVKKTGHEIRRHCWATAEKKSKGGGRGRKGYFRKG